MNPTVQSQIVWRNQQNSTDAQRFPSRSDGNLWGSNVRRIMGILQVICGVTELAVGIAVVFVPFGYYYHSKDYAAWGLWNGVFATVTGFVGVFSRRKKGMVVAYMVTSIIASVLSACCFIYSAYGAYSTWYGHGSGATDLSIQIILCITFCIQLVGSIIGASFTCSPLCFREDHTQQIIYFCISEGQLPPPAFTHDLGTTQPSNTFHNTVSLQPTSQNAFETNEPSKL